MSSIKNVTAQQIQDFLKVGLIAGLLSGFFKLGWEIPFPPRAPGRTGQPQLLWNDLGIQSQNWTYTYSGHVIHYGDLIIHFGFSILAAIGYIFLVHYIPTLSLGYGALAGVLSWIAFHQILLPACCLTPAPWNLPFEEQLSELVGHIFWMTSIECVRRERLYARY